MNWICISLKVYEWLWIIVWLDNALGIDYQYNILSLFNSALDQQHGLNKKIKNL